jgi:hypothetical protein
MTLSKTTLSIMAKLMLSAEHLFKSGWYLFVILLSVVVLSVEAPIFANWMQKQKNFLSKN